MGAERYLESRKTKTLAQISLILLLVVVFPALWYWWSLSRDSSSAGISFTVFLPGISGAEPVQKLSESQWLAALAPVPEHAVFPYSVIPGGVRSPRELQEATGRDALVAQHYSGFNFGTAQTIRLAKNKKAYVSYRVGNQIYWTRRKVPLRAGETLLTDGHSFARGRCGNRISETPKSPVSPEEPSERTMSTPLSFTDPAPLGFPVGDAPGTLTLFPAQNPALLLPPPSGAVPPGGPFPPLFPPIFPGPGTPKTPSNPFPPPVPPIVTTPEPGTLLFVLLGLGGLALLRIRRAIRTRQRWALQSNLTCQ